MPSKQSRPRICVFCSTKLGKADSGPAAARDLAHSLHKRDADLIYGGGTTGLMGELAKERVKLGGPGSVIGVIPYALLDRERNVEGNLTVSKKKISNMLSQLGLNKTSSISEKEQLGDDASDLPPDPNFGRAIGVSSLGRRKAAMMDLVNHGGNGSGFMALPGGLGSLDEILEIITHRQLGVHQFPMVLVNVDGFWNGMKMWTEDAYDKGFLGGESKSYVKIVDTPEEGVEYLMNYRKQSH